MKTGITLTKCRLIREQRRRGGKRVKTIEVAWPEDYATSAAPWEIMRCYGLHAVAISGRVYLKEPTRKRALWLWL